MSKKRQLILWLFTMIGLGLYAQRTVTGTVSDSKNNPIGGASIRLKGTSIGAKSKSDGSYLLNIPQDKSGFDSLEVSYIGFKKQVKAITGSILDFSIDEDARGLSEVIVTAQGVKRKKNTLPFAAQQVTGNEVSQARTGNFVQNLSGKASGIEVKQSNSLGGSTNVVIRGSKSLTGSNQALFVVDGVPYTNGNNNETDQRRGYGGFDYGNTAADINPDDIESITVLKGAAASALYGSLANNGVVLITTKKGKRGVSRDLGISFQTGVTLGMVDKSTLPKYQKLYGAGNALDQVDIDGDGVDDLVTQTYEDASSGAKFDQNIMAYQWESFDPKSPNYMKPMPYVAAKNDPSTFFKNSVSINNSIFVSSTVDKLFYKLGYTRNDDWGIMPNSKVAKNLLNLSATYNLLDNLSLSGDFNFSRTDGKGRYQTGYDNSNILGSFRQWWQNNVDVVAQEDAYNRNNGANATWNIADNTAFNPNVYSSTTLPNYWNNPYFTRYKNYETDFRNRIFGTAALNYKLNDNWNFIGRANLDNYTDVQEERIAKGSIGATLQGMSTDQISGYSKKVSSQNNQNFDLIANYEKDINEDFNLRGIAGWNLRQTEFLSTLSATNGGLVVSGLYSLNNSVNTPLAPTESEVKTRTMGLYAGATLTYKEMLILDGTIRRDESSTLPAGNNVYYYPSVSAGFIFSKWKALNEGGVINKDKTYGKLRLNYAEVGNSAPAYSTNDYFTFSSTFGSVPMFTASNTKNNSSLRPERSKSWEVGMEMTFQNNRFGFDATYYNTKSQDQILPVSVSNASGYAFKYVNAGVVQNQGVELSVFATPVKKKDFSWDFNINWTKNTNKVLELYDANTTNLSIGSFPGGSVSVNASVGDPYGQLRGKDYVYLNGERVVDPATGKYKITTTTSNNIGNIQPNWTAGITNKFRYKNFNLSFLVDIKNGGDVFSLDMYYAQSTGLYESSIKYNELGNLERDAIADGGGLILPGVLPDGTPNTTRIEANPDGYGLIYGGYYAPSKEFVYDASYVKLREVVLGYNIPSKVFGKKNIIKSASINVFARNLWIIYKNLPYSDPEDILSSGNAQGYQTGAMPSVRTLGVNFKFGF